ncbi:MAG: hypothetical protein BWX73_02323 [Lentisphaerae bacterium ADurb.Bin082]|nr:MAG: hypothetical protein BWX73_02323 [Lentisphaerae bacterium ADurb.Bin082]
MKHGCAIIGGGGFAVHSTTPTISSLGQFDLHAIVESQEQRAVELKRNFQELTITD